MKQIEKISIWDNGKTQNAEIINTYGTHLSLGKLAQFYYVLYTKDKQVLIDGSVTMTGEDYQKWSDSDDYAWEFVAGQLNLVIIGDWVEPIVEVDKTAEKLNSDFPLFDALIESETIKESLTVGQTDQVNDQVEEVVSA